MDRDTACRFLESLAERVVIDPATGRLHLPGTVSAHELNALKVAIASLGGTSHQAVSPTPPMPPPAEPQDRSSLRSASTYELDLRSLDTDQPADPDVLLCLDFGTAMSKAYAVVVDDGEAAEQLPLRLGRRAGDGRLIYPVPSSIWISDDGMVHVGARAIALSLQDSTGKRQRFDSLKRHLTRGVTQTSPDQLRLEPEINPTAVPLTQGDAITLYLAYLTDLACSELADVHGKSRFVRRRFALPSWSPERRQWGEKELREMLARAQVLGDTFHGRWDSGIPVSDAKAALDAVRALPRRPSHLVAEGVPEPLAAGASRLRRDEPLRGLAIVVDIGAGTTDFALFLVAENPEREIFKAWPIDGCSEALHMAGDHLDIALRLAILEDARAASTDPEFRDIDANLRLRLREYKETLFDQRTLTYNLVDGSRGTIELAHFLEREEVSRFKDRLETAFNEVVGRAHRTFGERLADGALTVVLTGGGADLPMVRALTEGPSSISGFRLHRRGAPLVPDTYMSDPELSEVYPQLAVAIGGAMPSLIGEGGALKEMPGLTEQGFVIVPTQISGT